MRLRFFHYLTKPLNWVIPKKNAIYACPHTNCRTDSYDLINYSSDNLLCVVNYLYEHYYDEQLVIYLECYSEARLPILVDYIDSHKKGNLRIIPVLSHKTVEHPMFNKAIAAKNALIRFRCKIWIVDTPHVHYYEKVKGQKYICLNYGTPFKSENQWNDSENTMNLDYSVYTSTLAAHVLASEYIHNFYHSVLLGFPRNDTLFLEYNKHRIEDWIYNKTRQNFKKIIVYAPTYRDYRGAFEKGVFGYEDVDYRFQKFLEDNNIVVIVKMHPHQEVNNYSFTNNVIPYECTYDFSLYDLLAISDLLISDYSSLIHDYIITGKKVVLNWFDEDLYDTSRGFSFDPIEDICPGPIAHSLDELIALVNEALFSTDIWKEQERVLRLFHKHIDANSTERVASFLMEQIKNC